MVIDGSVGTPAARMSSLDPTFEPMASMAAAGGPTQMNPAPVTTRAKSPDSDRKPYPGWMASAPGARGGVEDHRRAQIGVGRGHPGQAHGQVGLAHMRALGVGVRVDGHRGDPHGSRRPHDAPGDLAAVGHQQGADGA